MEASEWVLQAVQKLQVRLAATTRPKKLRRYLERLSALPVTPHILVETGVRKTVKSLRKHQLVGSLARDLAARWKKLSLLERAPGRGPQDSQHSLSPKRPGDALAQENLHPGSQATWRGPGSPSDPPGHGHQEHGEPWRSHRAHQSSPSRQRRPGSKKHPRLAAWPSHWGSSGGGPAQASRRAASPPPTSGDPPEPSAPGHGPAKGRLPYSPDETLLLQARPLSGPQEEEDLWPRAQEMGGNQEHPKGRKPGHEEFEEPTMSFEAFLTYDQPPKRERKPKASATARKGKEPKGKDSQRGRKPLDSVENVPPALGNPSGKRQPAQGDRARMGEVSAEAPAVPPGWPFPGLQHQHSPPAARDLMGFFRPNATALPSPEKEEEGGFTGRRTNSKTQVYSGGKRAHLAPMTWHQQHSQALTDPASLLEEKALPHALRQAALQNGTPDQLCHLERAEPGPREETDEPWRLHCHREFKAETPQENESWREMYLRLQDAREQRLQALTLRIRSAHPPESQGRKTKMIFFKLPAEVPRRPQKLGTVAAAASGEPHFQPARDPTGSRGSPTSSSSLDPRAETPAGASVNSARAHRAPAANTSTPTARKIAPLMAKTIKDYKRLTSRR